MAVGMTLNQLYADGSASTSSSSTSGATAATTTTTSSHGRGKVQHAEKTAGVHYESNGMNGHHPHAAYQVAPSHYHQQQQQQYGYSGQYQPQHHAGKGADDYAADPLPFEYHGIRKYADSYVPHHPAAYGNHSQQQQQQMSKSVDDHSRQQHPSYQHSGYQPHPSERSHYHPASEIPAHFPHSSHHTSAPQMFANSHSQHPLTHSFPPLIDPHAPKKEVATADQQQYPQQHSSAAEYIDGRPSGGPQGASQEAMIKVKTPLKVKYWRNGRRNLQCFPSCKVFGDYSAIKIEDLKQHDFMWGKCRGSIVTEVTLNSNVSFDDIVILGRVHSLENIPVAFEEAVIRECMLGRMVEPDVMDSMKDQWISGERLPDFVQQDGNTACFEFKPKVWKYTEDMAQGKCKRRNVKYYVQFEAFVLVMAGERRYYACIGSGMSTSFEVGSSRVLARQKRKAATSSDDVKSGNQAIDMGGMQSMHHPMMAQHGMMGPPSHHGMAPSAMFQSNFHHHGGHDSMPPNRGLPSTFPHPQMHQVMSQDSQHHHQQQQAPAAVGSKRKANSDRAAYPTERASKLLKPMSAVQSVPL